MNLWLGIALMTAAAIFAVLWPLGRRKVKAGGSDVVVYRDQLAEIDRDRAAGLIGAPEADAAKIEVSRRLIAAADAADAQPTQPETSSLWRRRAAALAGLLLLPAGALALYLTLGSPQLPGEPLVARLRAIHQDKSIEALVSQVEAHIERNPNDVRAYEVLAPVYLRLGRFDDAVNAWHKVLALGGETAERQANLGEALMAAANGVVTDQAKAAFDRAQSLDPREPKSRFYSGVAAEQDGDHARAAKIWRGMLADAPANAPWVGTVRQALARVGGAPVAPPTAGPNAAAVAAAANMSEKDRDSMIRGMVARLADRLTKDGSDVDGWLRLVRSYRVLGENDKAQAAIADARHALANDPDKLREFAEGSGSAAPKAPTVPPAPAANAPGPSAADVAAAATMSEADRKTMIQAMVARLAGRLKQDGSDVEGWQRLLRAYMVMGERDKAHAAAADARRALAGDPDKLRRINEVIKGLGLES
jgi:cytochrome c-type biogenesis protein CcmH